jgi:hypothetical protein
MSDDTRIRALLDNYAGAAPTPDRRTDLWERGRTRRQRGRYAGVGAVVVATALAVLAYGALGTEIRSRPMPAGPVGPTPSATDVEFPMLPSQVYRATPVTDNPLITASFRTDDVAIYPDGLVVWKTRDGRYSQLRLNEAGVASILSTVTSTGLFEPQDDGARLMTSGSSGRLTLDSGSGWVTVVWGDWDLASNRGVKATPAQKHDLAMVYRLVHDPSSWSLPRDLYADPEIKPFWAYNYYLSYEFGPWDLDQLPEPVASLLAELSERPCSRPITATDARDLLDALVEAGFNPGINNQRQVYVPVPGRGPNGDTLLNMYSDIPVTCHPDHRYNTPINPDDL